MRQGTADDEGSPREEVSAGGVVYRPTPDGPVFLLIRDGYRNWGFPKGHLERDEDAETAAVREVLEETGLALVSLEAALGTIDWHFRHKGRLVHKTCHFFLMRSDAGEPVPQADEGISACRWYPFEAAVSRLSYANAREVLKAARGRLAAHES